MEITDEQRKRIEESRKKALLIRQEKSKARASTHPYQKYNFFLTHLLTILSISEECC